MWVTRAVRAVPAEPQGALRTNSGPGIAPGLFCFAHLLEKPDRPLTTRSDYERVRAQTRRDLKTGHVHWTGAVTGSGAPRTTLKGKTVDARRIIWSYENGSSLPPFARMRSLCGNSLCMSCVSYVGDGLADADFVTWSCACQNSVRVLPLANAVWCPGTPGKAHPARRMSRSLNGAESGSYSRARVFTPEGR